MARWGRGGAGGRMAVGLLAQNLELLLRRRQLLGELADFALRRIAGLSQAQQFRFHLHRARRRARSSAGFRKARTQLGIDPLRLVEARREGGFLVLRRAEAGARFPGLLLELVDRHSCLGRHRHIQRGSVAWHIDNGGRSPWRREGRIRRIGAVAQFGIRCVHGVREALGEHQTCLGRRRSDCNFSGWLTQVKPDAAGHAGRTPGAGAPAWHFDTL